MNPAAESYTCPCCGRPGLAPLIFPAGKHVDLRTGARPIAEWGNSAAVGFVRDSRFGSGQVIKGTNRATSRKWRQNSSTTTGTTTTRTGGDK